jgi:hypothetical protein
MRHSSFFQSSLFSWNSRIASRNWRKRSVRTAGIGLRSLIHSVRDKLLLLFSWPRNRCASSSHGPLLQLSHEGNSIHILGLMNKLSCLSAITTASRTGHRTCRSYQIVKHWTCVNFRAVKCIHIAPSSSLKMLLYLWKDETVPLSCGLHTSRAAEQDIWGHSINRQSRGMR